jgi:hypothetical protein
MREVTSYQFHQCQGAMGRTLSTTKQRVIALLVVGLCLHSDVTAGRLIVAPTHERHHRQWKGPQARVAQRLQCIYTPATPCTKAG